MTDDKQYEGAQGGDTRLCTLNLQFSADATEYFRIWIANLALSLATFGIFSAWSKVRRTRYLYGHTQLDGKAFSFLADPLRLLRGRMVAVLVVILWIVIGLIIARYQLTVPLPYMVFGYLTTLLVTAVVAPVLIVSIARFRMRNLRYVDLRFNFLGSYSEAMVAFGFWLLLCVPTAGLLYPLARFHAVRYVTSNATCGGRHFEFTGNLKEQYTLYIEAITMFVATTLAASTLIYIAGRVIDQLTLNLLSTAMMAFLLAFFYGYLKAANMRYVFHNLRLGDIYFRCTLESFYYAWVYAVNAFAIGISLGLLVPWARIRTMRILLSSIEVESDSSLADFIAENLDETETAGEESAELLDIEMEL